MRLRSIHKRCWAWRACFTPNGKWICISMERLQPTHRVHTAWRNWTSKLQITGQPTVPPDLQPLLSRFPRISFVTYTHMIYLSQINFSSDTKPAQVDRQEEVKLFYHGKINTQLFLIIVSFYYVSTDTRFTAYVMPGVLMYLKSKHNLLMM